MASIRTVAVFGASGNFGKPITAALVEAGFNVTVITRDTSPSAHPTGLPVIKTDYTLESLTKALQGQDAAVSVIGPAGISSAVTMVEAAHAASVRRYIINDFGWGPDFNSLPEFNEIGGSRRVAWNRAKELAEVDSASRKPEEERFSWTGVTIGNPIDWALQRFPPMGFDVSRRLACIYDNGTEQFTGTTLSGIGQAVAGVMNQPGKTANRFVKVRSIQTCQNELLRAFNRAALASGDPEWTVQQSSAQNMLKTGREKHGAGNGGWRLDLMVFQLYDPGMARCVVSSREDSDMNLLGVDEENADDIVKKVLTGL